MSLHVHGHLFIEKETIEETVYDHNILSCANKYSHYFIKTTYLYFQKSKPFHD